MPRSEAANQRLRDAQRATILAGARAAFARQGLAATMADVAAAAGVSQGLAYRYFAGKDEIFRAIVEEATRSDGRAIVPAMPGTAGERLRAIITRLVERRREQPEFFQILHHVLSDRSAPRDLFARLDQRGQEFRQILRQLIAEAQATGEVADDDPDQLVTAISACLEGLTQAALRRSRQSQDDFPSAAIVLRMLGLPGAPAASRQAEPRP